MGPRPRSRRCRLATLVVLLIAASASWQPTPAAAFSSFSGSSGARWIVYYGALKMVQSLDPALASQFWNSTQTNVQNSSDPPTSQVPSGWSSVPDQKYTAYGDCSTTGDPSCTSLTTDINNGSLKSSAIPVVMYDNESWTATPSNEQTAPCSFMQQFASLAHANGFTTIMAPAQDLVSVNTSFTGGESQNWQAFLRLGYPSCAATGGTDRYHIQAQANQEDPDFDEFTTQAMLQAFGGNSNVVVTTGLAADKPSNGDVPTPQKMYQDSLDAQSIGAQGFWMNIPGTSSGTDQRPDDVIQLFELESGMLPFYLHTGGGLNTTFPTSTTATTFSLGTAGATLTSVGSQSLPAGAVIPSGSYKFQDFTDGTGGSAGLGYEVGYCVASSCSGSHTKLVSWSGAVNAGDLGPTSTATTSTATTLPSGGPYVLYTAVTVNTAGPFNLLYDASSASLSAETNLAIPRPSSMPAPSAQSPMFFLHAGGSGDNNLPTSTTASTMSLGTVGASQTWVSSQTYPAGTVIPAGRWLFQAWTDGTSGTAQLGLEFGYCTASSCATSHNVIVPSTSWDPTVSAGSKGDNLDPNGLSSYTTYGSTTLPAGGPYSLYLTVTVTSAGSFNLQFDSKGTATNAATPFLQAVTPATPPAAPTNLTATAGNTQVSLSWTASSGATNYNVYRSTTNGGPYTQITSGVTTTSYTDTGVTNGTTYYYVVTAVSSSGESGHSNQASATPAATSAPKEVQVGSLVRPGSGSCSPTLPAASTAGNLLVATLATGGGTFTFSGPSGWVKAVGVTSSKQDAEIWYYPNDPGGITSATFSSGASFSRCQLSEWSGVATSSPLDKTGSSTTNSAASATVSTSAATAYSSDLAITTWALDLGSSSSVTFTPGSGWTNLGNTGSAGVRFNATFDYDSGASGTVSETETSSLSGNWAGIIATFHP